jgi:Undecaprenyl-phosphate glucose phosphotransferase
MVSYLGDVAGSADSRKSLEKVYLDQGWSGMNHPQKPFRLSRVAVSLIMATGDFAAILVSAAAVAAAYRKFAPGSVPETWILPALLAAILFVSGFERIGGYKVTGVCLLKSQIKYVLGVWASAASCLLLVVFLETPSGRAWALLVVTAAPAVLIAMSHVRHMAVVAWGRCGYLVRNVVIIGSGEESQRLITKLQASGDRSVAVRGIFAEGCDLELPKSICGVTVFGTTEDLLQCARTAPIDDVIIALPLDAASRVRELCDRMKILALDVRLSIEPLAELVQARGTSHIGNIPLLQIVDRPLKHWRAIIKAIEDKTLAAGLLVALAPLMAIISILIKLDSPGPILFVQKRFGFNNEVIHVLKFRSMRVDHGDPSGAQRTVHDDARVTRLGRVLRCLSLDELPQLINVLRGDMSIVGPRPHAIAMKVGNRLYSEAVDEYLHRHRVKPGITGLAQVSGSRGEVDSIEKGRARVTYDLHYIEKWSLWLDLKILAKTLGVVLSGKDAW